MTDIVKTDRPRYRGLAGTQGSWVVTIMWENGTEELAPVAHAKFYDYGSKIYKRDDSTLEKFKRYPGKLASWFEHLHLSHKVVMTRDIWKDGAPPKRDGYIGVFDIAEMEFEGAAGHKFKITNRYQKTAA